MGPAEQFFCFFWHQLRSLIELNQAGRSKPSLTYLELHCSFIWPLFMGSSGFFTAWWSQGVGFSGTSPVEVDFKRKAEGTRPRDPRTGTASLLSRFISHGNSKANPDSRIGEKKSHGVMIVEWGEQRTCTWGEEIDGGRLWRLSEKARNTDSPHVDPQNSWGPLLSL